MNVKLENKVLYIEGNLDETNSSKSFDDVIVKVKAIGSDEPIALDLNKVPRANSYGILLFLRFLKNSEAKFKYVNSPVWLVEQFNMITQFLVNGSYVESVQVPFYCNEDDSEEIILLEIGKDIPILANYDEFEIPDRNINGKPYEADVSPERYFSFISSHIKSFSPLMRS